MDTPEMILFKSNFRIPYYLKKEPLELKRWIYKIITSEVPIIKEANIPINQTNIIYATSTNQTLISLLSIVKVIHPYTKTEVYGIEKSPNSLLKTDKIYFQVLS